MYILYVCTKKPLFSDIYTYLSCHFLIICLVFYLLYIPVYAIIIIIYCIYVRTYYNYVLFAEGETVIFRFMECLLYMYIIYVYFCIGKAAFQCWLGYILHLASRGKLPFLFSTFVQMSV